jgi:small nuclear ribonucleoprotein D3
VELRNGELYRGYLDEAEDNMNCVLKDAMRTATDGKVFKVDYVFIRGSQIMFVIFPSMLRHAPMFKRIKIWREYKGHPPQNLGAATGPRGQAAVIIRKAQERQGGKGIGGKGTGNG